MDDEDLPLSSPLPLSQPAVQALIDNQDALPSSESTGGDNDVDMEESDTSPFFQRAPASSKRGLPWHLKAPGRCAGVAASPSEHAPGLVARR